jgi:predicted RNase H-like HicB family nuclease
MTTYSLVVDSGREGYSAYVPELPTILVTGASQDELLKRATDAVRVYIELRLAQPTSWTSKNSPSPASRSRRAE